MILFFTHSTRASRSKYSANCAFFHERTAYQDSLRVAPLLSCLPHRVPTRACRTLVTVHCALFRSSLTFVSRTQVFCAVRFCSLDSRIAPEILCACILLSSVAYRAPRPTAHRAFSHSLTHRDCIHSFNVILPHLVLSLTTYPTPDSLWAVELEDAPGLHGGALWFICRLPAAGGPALWASYVSD